MVRLKDAVTYLLLYFNSLISIPYGAIKSIFLYSKTNSYTLFQFLMVRLKAYCIT